VSTSRLCGALVLCALAVGCHRGQVRLPAYPGAQRHLWRQPVALAEFRRPCEDLLYDVTAPVGYAAAVQSPPDSFAIGAMVRWNEAVSALRRHFDDLASRHNAAVLSVQEFEQRAAELSAAAGELRTLRAWLDSALEARRQAVAAGPESAASSAEGEARREAEAVWGAAGQLVQELGSLPARAVRSGNDL